MSNSNKSTVSVKRIYVRDNKTNAPIETVIVKMTIREEAKTIKNALKAIGLNLSVSIKQGYITIQSTPKNRTGLTSSPTDVTALQNIFGTGNYQYGIQLTICSVDTILWLIENINRFNIIVKDCADSLFVKKLAV